jgi:hypothetical protein
MFGHGVGFVTAEVDLDGDVLGGGVDEVVRVDRVEEDKAVAGAGCNTLCRLPICG